MLRASSSEAFHLALLLLLRLRGAGESCRSSYRPSEPDTPTDARELPSEFLSIKKEYLLHPNSNNFVDCRHPEVKWAQTVDKVYITVLLPDAKNAKVNLEPDGDFTFSASAGAENHLYELKLDLLDKVIVEESKINTGVRSIFCVIEKAEKGWWKKLLRGHDKTPHYVKIDWDKWVDEDDDNGMLFYSMCLAFSNLFGYMLSYMHVCLELEIIEFYLFF
ncbi:hypothetical protein HHK36_026509 [Tetracentron sinense]|uniref:Co-chaperone protein p23 n=1 Tax=Tetracentron sinense TaxID=13715 RepID=A0A834YKJ2_TETSI|nr:hypothetical protein HHK36_026509 [Tetracentron sinense]